MKKNLFYQKAGYILLILIAAYLLTPRFWEPAPETWRSWAAARILKETGGFPVFSLGPGYIIYLLSFQVFQHPFSLHLEYFITHIFTYTALFLLLTRLLPRFFAFLFICAWIPHLAILEGTATVAAIGFLALYIYFQLRSPAVQEKYLPNILLAASLCHLAYAPFLLGHFIAVALKKILVRQPLLHFSGKLCWRKIPAQAIKVLLLSVIVLGLLFQSKRWDNNHMFIDEKYTPVSVKSGLNAAFFGDAIITYLDNIMPDSGRQKDWYFSKKEVWGDISNIAEGIVKKPKLMVMVFRENFRYFLQMPKHLFSEADFKNPYGMLFTLVCFLLFIMGITGLFLNFKADKPNPLIFSIALGSFATIGTLMLTAFSRRYIPVLLPVWFLVLVYAAQEAWRLGKLATDKIGIREERKILFALLIFFIIGAILNKATLSVIFHIRLPAKIAVFVWFVDFLLIAGVALCIVLLLRHLHKLKQAAPQGSYILIVCLSASLLFLSAKYPYGWKGQFRALISNQGSLVKNKAVSMESIYPSFAKNIDSQTKILALEDIWFKAFTKIGLDNIYSLFSLPPFADFSGQTEKLLAGLDEIWVSESMISPEPMFLTQVALRYQLHVEPFLKKVLREKSWVAEDIDKFGKRYRKIKK